MACHIPKWISFRRVGYNNRLADIDRNGPEVARQLVRCFLRLANLPNLALDRLSRYEATLWRQAGRILYALDALDRRKPQERRRRSRVDDWRDLPTPEDDDC